MIPVDYNEERGIRVENASKFRFGSSEVRSAKNYWPKRFG